MSVHVAGIARAPAYFCCCSRCPVRNVDAFHLQSLKISSCDEFEVVVARVDCKNALRGDETSKPWEINHGYANWTGMHEGFFYGGRKLCGPWRKSKVTLSTSYILAEARHHASHFAVTCLTTCLYSPGSDRTSKATLFYCDNFSWIRAYSCIGLPAFSDALQRIWLSNDVTIDFLLLLVLVT